MSTTFRIGAAQTAALELWVFDVAHEDDDERRIDGRLEAGALVVDGDLDAAYRALTDAANAADDDAEGLGQPGLDAEHRAAARKDRDALTALSARVLKKIAELKIGP